MELAAAATATTSELARFRCRRRCNEIAWLHRRSRNESTTDVIVTRAPGAAAGSEFVAKTKTESTGRWSASWRNWSSAGRKARERRSDATLAGGALLRIPQGGGSDYSLLEGLVRLLEQCGMVERRPDRPELIGLAFDTP